MSLLLSNCLNFFVLVIFLNNNFLCTSFQVSAATKEANVTTQNLQKRLEKLQADIAFKVKYYYWYHGLIFWVLLCWFF